MKKKFLVFWLVVIQAILGSVIIGQTTSYYPISSTLWEGNSYSGNVPLGSWMPTQGSNSTNFSYDDYSWGQVHTKNYISKGSTVQFTTQLLLNSGGVNRDEAYFGFGEKWAAYDGNAAGICFSNKTIYTFKTISSTSVYPTLLQSIGTYTTNENITFSLTLNNDGTITYNIKGATGTFNPGLNISSYRIMMTCANTQDGFNISAVNLNTSTNIDYVSDHLPVDFTLYQNYPNPFNPSTTIKFAIREISHVQIKIYDLNGRLIKTIIDEVKAVGVHTVVWDSKNTLGHEIAAGTYFCQVRSGNTLKYNKMLLIK